mmetsp:Transcript_18288/g.27423  ORF Transcript_18288/g.27423 Transcript_18288/m.27423 type:complete len:85 (+) Transcript_18288:623-877(+)
MVHNKAKGKTQNLNYLYSCSGSGKRFSSVQFLTKRPNDKLFHALSASILVEYLSTIRERRQKAYTSDLRLTFSWEWAWLWAWRS